ncbi:class I SAM-dependent methyltransferase [Mycobacterium sp. 3519A]|jgi:ubiquinone/menaquinone biosynthesis C-methylase UbiE|uniref:class I SAM-dependent methyltransferase n=1 Tax=Mycobacterium sp. 3519A TaxID=2057184 RepID=UPI000C7A58AE|nr:class I SAM-dependent methyltransferase [Mycobacterium sp. 3519A]
MTDIAIDAKSSAWLRAFAVLYDPFLWLGEIAGMRRRRRALVAAASGLVVEIGAGTGLNVAHYPDAVDELILTEPEPGMQRKLTRRLQRLSLPARVVDAPAERLPVPDASVDTVVSTLVLCTVDDPQGALREIARVLRPGGQLLFIEHVRAGSRLLAAWQDLLMRPWRGFAGGCVCNRPTLDLMRGCGFSVEADDAVWRGMPAVVHPLAIGRATR